MEKNISMQDDDFIIKVIAVAFLCYFTISLIIYCWPIIFPMIGIALWVYFSNKAYKARVKARREYLQRAAIPWAMFILYHAFDGLESQLGLVKSKTKGLDLEKSVTLTTGEFCQLKGMQPLNSLNDVRYYCFRYLRDLDAPEISKLELEHLRQFLKSAANDVIAKNGGGQIEILPEIYIQTISIIGDGKYLSVVVFPLIDAETRVYIDEWEKAKSK